MANLDDFFKKKDGKKKLKGKKFAVSNPSLSTGEPIKNGKVKQEKPSSFTLDHTLSDNGTDLFSSQQTDEWKEFVEEKKDYTGLKIQHLQINDDENNKYSTKDQESDEETEIDDSGQTIVRKKQPAGPWKIVSEPKIEEEKPKEKKESTRLQEPERNTYVCPAKRYTEVEKPNSRAKNSNSSKESFPTLSSTVSNSNLLNKK